METENGMENREIDIENDHETTSAAHNMENQQRDIENDLETTSAAPDDVAFAIEEFTVGIYCIQRNPTEVLFSGPHVKTAVFINLFHALDIQFLQGFI
jgi:hypothetical protein